jgi:hypothetical protein
MSIPQFLVSLSLSFFFPFIVLVLKIISIFLLKLFIETLSYLAFFSYFEHLIWKIENIDIMETKYAIRMIFWYKVLKQKH